jgi:hypothetical protein
MVQRVYVLTALRANGTEKKPVRTYGMAPYEDRVAEVTE